MSSTRRCVRIRHRATGRVLAEGPLGWGITPFEGNLYIRRRYLRLTDSLDVVTHGFFTRQGGVSTGIYAALNVQDRIAS